MSPWTPDFEFLLRRHCRVEPEEAIDPDAQLATLGVSSLTFLALLVDIEARFAVVVPDAMLVEGKDTPLGLWQTVSTLVDRRGGGGAR